MTQEVTVESSARIAMRTARAGAANCRRKYRTIILVFVAFSIWNVAVIDNLDAGVSHVKDLLAAKIKKAIEREIVSHTNTTTIARNSSNDCERPDLYEDHRGTETTDCGVDKSCEQRGDNTWAEEHRCICKQRSCSAGGFCIGEGVPHWLQHSVNKQMVGAYAIDIIFGLLHGFGYYGMVRFALRAPLQVAAILVLSAKHKLSVWDVTRAVFTYSGAFTRVAILLNLAAICFPFNGLRTVFAWGFAPLLVVIEGDMLALWLRTGASRPVFTRSKELFERAPGLAFATWLVALCLYHASFFAFDHMILKWTLKMLTSGMHPQWLYTHGVDGLASHVDPITYYKLKAVELVQKLGWNTGSEVATLCANVFMVERLLKH